MRIKGLNGREYNVKVADYLIDWSRKVSGPQKQVKDFLYPYWKTDIVTEEFPVPSGRGRPVRFDLVNWSKRIVIEVSPRSSHSFNRFFHGSRVGFSAAVKRDLQKSEWAEANRFVFVELGTEDIAQLSREWFREHYKDRHGEPLEI